MLLLQLLGDAWKHYIIGHMLMIDATFPYLTLLIDDEDVQAFIIMKSMLLLSDYYVAWWLLMTIMLFLPRCLGP